MGVWIEIRDLPCIICSVVSLPAWECGLKLDMMEFKDGRNTVTPCVGVWIEIIFTLFN